MTRVMDRVILATGWRRWLMAVASGAVGALAMPPFGFLPALVLSLSVAVWLALWALYLSIVNVGQVWYSFGWETLLCEVGFLAVFFGALNVVGGFWVTNRMLAMFRPPVKRVKRRA